MVRSTARLVTLAMLASTACASRPQPKAGPHTVLSEIVTDPSGSVKVEVRYDQNPPDKIALVVSLSAVGIDEMDKIAIDVTTDAFAVLEGSSQWSGFVPPRERHEHRMLLLASEDTGHGSVTVTMSRFHDSEVLWQDTASFTFTGTIVVAD
jgi:hypothetical protein